MMRKVLETRPRFFWVTTMGKTLAFWWCSCVSGPPFSFILCLIVGESEESPKAKAITSQ